MKNKIAIITVFLFTLVIGTVNADSRMNVVINGQTVLFDHDPIVQNGVTLVQFKPVFNDLGIGISWSQAKKQIVGAKGGTSIILNVGQKKAYVNGSPVLLQVAPKVVEGSVFVPLRFISEATGASINVSGKIIEITSHPESSSVPTVTISKAPSSSNSYTTDKERNQYLANKYPALYINGRSIDVNFSGSTDSNGLYSLVIQFTDIDDMLYILEENQNDRDIVYRLTRNIAYDINKIFKQDETSIFLQVKHETTFDPLGLPQDIVTLLPNGNYQTLRFIYVVSYDFVQSEAWIFLMDDYAEPEYLNTIIF